MDNPPLGDQVRTTCRHGDHWTAEEIHEGVKRFRPRFVILPPNFPPEVARRLFVSDREIASWGWVPTLIYRSYNDTIFSMANYLTATRTSLQWNAILDALAASWVWGDAEAAAAIKQGLPGLPGAAAHERLQAKVSDPDDWIYRLERIEQSLSEKM